MRIPIDTFFKVTFNYDKKVTRLINKPCYLLDKKDSLRCNKDSELADWTLVARFKNESLSDSVNIIYSAGMSDDPGFVISTKSDKTIGRFSCIDFYINASGTIYTSGHVNNMFNRRRKFQIQKDSVIEIIQPFCYVGLKGKALLDVTLYKDKVGNEVIAQLPKGYEIEVLLADGNSKDFEMDHNFLVKTEFGLVGWLRIENSSEPVLKDFYYKGD